jgi:hypothetical protein
MSAFMLPANARMLSPSEALQKTGSEEPCYQLYRADGSLIVGALVPINEKKFRALPGIVAAQSRPDDAPPPQRHYDADGNEVGPWIHVYSHAEKQEMRRVRKMYAGQTFQIRDDDE